MKASKENENTKKEIQAIKDKAAPECPEPLDECFVIMPISDQEDYAPGHFTRVYEDIVKPACAHANVTPKRADEVKKTNLIHADILISLLHAPIAICDLSSKNPNVLFELGIRQAFDKPVVLIKDEKTTNIFDISILRYETYNSERRYDEVVKAQTAIARCIQDTLGDSSKKYNSIINLLSMEKASLKEETLKENDYIHLLFNEIKMLTSKVDSLSREFAIRTNPTLGSNLFYRHIEQGLDLVEDLLNKCKGPQAARMLARIKKELSTLEDAPSHLFLRHELLDRRLEEETPF